MHFWSCRLHNLLSSYKALPIRGKPGPINKKWGEQLCLVSIRSLKCEFMLARNAKLSKASRQNFREEGQNSKQASNPNPKICLAREQSLLNVGNTIFTHISCISFSKKIDPQKLQCISYLRELIVSHWNRSIEMLSSNGSQNSCCFSLA